MELCYTPFDQAAQALGIPVAVGEPMSRHTTFQIGGPAVFWCTPKTVDQLRRTLALCRENGVRTYLLGNGSNTLFADEGYDGAVIDLRGLNFGPTAEPQPDGSTHLTAGAGLTLGRLCAVAQQQGLAGLAFACGIPGTIGGAVYMNAGAYGGEMKDVLESVTFLDSDLTERTLPAAELALGYRTSLFEQHPDWCVLSATVRLQPGDSAAILAEMQDYLQRRKDKQPIEWPSAGSTFKRPPGYYTGPLIRQAGLAGLVMGGAQVSKKHTGLSSIVRRQPRETCCASLKPFNIRSGASMASFLNRKSGSLGKTRMKSGGADSIEDFSFSEERSFVYG